jgi:hypothetical protein
MLMDVPLNSVHPRRIALYPMSPRQTLLDTLYANLLFRASFASISLRGTDRISFVQVLDKDNLEGFNLHRIPRVVGLR